MLTPDSSPGHDNSAKLLFPSEPRPPGTKNTLKTLILFPFFFLFVFRYKMIQTTIQNICAVDDYKKVGTSVSPHDAQSCSVNTSYSGIFPKTTTVMRAATHLSIFKNKHAKKIIMKKKRKKKARCVPGVYGGGWFPPAGWCGRAYSVFGVNYRTWRSMQGNSALSFLVLSFSLGGSANFPSPR